MIYLVGTLGGKEIMKKIALLFGNNDYPESKLNNASNDAQDLSERLKNLGFNCICKINSSCEEMNRTITEFRLLLDDYEVGIVFFAGHGVQVDGINYLAAIDTNFVDETACKYTSLCLDYVIEILEKSKISTKIIILDACRTNPFERKWRGTASRGLAPVYAPKGTIIAYATSPGQVALDGSGNNGAFTSALLTHIETPKITIEELFKRVRNTLSAITRNKQISWEHTSLMGDFIFNTDHIDGEFSTTYAKEVLSDSDHIFREESSIKNIIVDLKSHDWYTQNPGINKLRSLDYSGESKNEIFLLGRNIYQAACGSARSAMAWVDSLESNLDNLHPEVAFHLMNGILYEIYFNSKGKLRKNFKIGYYSPVLKTASTGKYNSSCKFIWEYLQQYSQRVLYLPGTDKILYLDVVISLDETDDYFLETLSLEGINILYNAEGTELYDYEVDGDFFKASLKISAFESKIQEYIVAPKENIIFNYSNKQFDPDEHIIVPYEFTLLKYSL